MNPKVTPTSDTSTRYGTHVALKDGNEIHNGQLPDILVGDFVISQQIASLK